MLQLTHEAATELAQLGLERGLPDTCGIRVFGEQRSGDELAMEITFAQVPAEHDRVTEREGTRVFVAPEVAVLLSSVALDIERHRKARSWSLRSTSQAERPDGPPWALPPSSAPVSAQLSSVDGGRTTKGSPAW